MKIKKVYEKVKTNYYEKLGYDQSINSYLVSLYGLWTDAENLEPLSADEHDRTKLTSQQNEFLDAFIKLWDLTDEFEWEYIEDDWYDNWLMKKNAKKFNI